MTLDTIHSAVRGDLVLGLATLAIGGVALALMSRAGPASGAPADA
jgi:hypothetical protein